jgi:hypothetical protein
MLSFGIAKMFVPAERLPQKQTWVGLLRSRGALITVTFVLYGEAALTVVSSHLLSELG